MQMLVSHMPCFHGESFPCADCLEYPFQLVFNVSVGQYSSAIFGCPYHMIFAEVGAVAEVVQSSIGHRYNHRVWLIVFDLSVIVLFYARCVKRTHRLKPVVFIIKK